MEESEIGFLMGIHDNSSKDTSSNTTFGRIRQMVECNVWSKWTVSLNIYFVEMCLKFCLQLVENIIHLSRKKKLKGNNFILNLGQFFIQNFC